MCNLGQGIFGRKGEEQTIEYKAATRIYFNIRALEVLPFMKIFLSAFLIFCLLFLYSCGEHQVGAGDILSKMLEGESQLPFGNIYLISADEGEVEYLSDRVKNILYGDSAAKEVFPLIKDYLAMLSALHI